MAEHEINNYGREKDRPKAVVVGKKELRETKQYSMRDLCITSSVWFPDFDLNNEEASDTVRGKLAVGAIVNALKAGCSYSLVYNSGTSEAFLERLRKKVKEVLGDEENRFVLTEREGLEYSPTRQLAFEKGREAFGKKVLVTQEAEKDLAYTYEDFLAEINKGAHIVLFDRGVATIMGHVNPAGLPLDQLAAERSQDLEMDKVEKHAGLLPQRTEAFDRLIGFRMVLDEEVEVAPGVLVNPLDLFAKVKFEYEDGYDQKAWGKFGVDFYSQGVYHGIVLAEALGLTVASVLVKYEHDPKQTQLEMDPKNRPGWKEKRWRHRKTIPMQHFDMVANVLKWKEEGRWPDIIVEGLKEDKPIGLVHYDRGKYTIDEGKLMERERTTSWVANGEVR